MWVAHRRAPGACGSRKGLLQIHYCAVRIALPGPGEDRSCERRPGVSRVLGWRVGLHVRHFRSASCSGTAVGQRWEISGVAS